MAERGVGRRERTQDWSNYRDGPEGRGRVGRKSGERTDRQGSLVKVE